jgi:hypothetical protein
MCSGAKGLGDCLLLQLTRIGCEDLQNFRVCGLLLISAMFLHTWSTILDADLDQNRGQVIKPGTLEWIPIYSALEPSGTNSARAQSSSLG